MAINPAFEGVAASYGEPLALALSQTLEPELFVFSVGPEQNQTAAPTEWPPELSVLKCVTVATQTRVRGETHKRFVPISGGLPRSAIVDSYARTVDPLQQRMTGLIAALRAMGDNLEGFAASIPGLCLEIGSRAGATVAAAHFVATVESTGRHIDALAYPRAVDEEFPFLLREALVPVIGAIREAAPEAQEEFEPLMTLGPRSKAHAAAVMASFLPPLGAIRQALS